MTDIEQPPLDQHIVDVLTRDCSADAAAAVRELAERALAGLVGEADAADVASLSPLANRQQAADLRSKATDLRFEADRLEASVSALCARVAELRELEESDYKQQQRNAALAERDALAGEIADRYPMLIAELTSLAKRIAESDTRCKAVGITESAEAIGRNVPAIFYLGGGPIMRIGQGRLPMPFGKGLAWGPDSRGMYIEYPGIELGDQARRAEAA
jgi:hypothetical protein